MPRDHVAKALPRGPREHRPFTYTSIRRVSDCAILCSGRIIGSGVGFLQNEKQDQPHL
jgi:hypothetical protein